MGYRRRFRTHVIRYGGEHPLAGFECDVTAMPLGMTLDLQAKGYELRQHDAGSPGYLAALNELLDLFASQVESWNVEDPVTGEPIAPSAEAVLSEFEGELAQDIILDWIDITNGKVSDPKAPAPSGSGQPSLEVPIIPMAAL